MSPRAQTQPGGRLAPHVRAAIERGGGRAPVQAQPQPEGKLAPHVRAAIDRGKGRAPVQAQPQPGDSLAPHVRVALQSNGWADPPGPRASSTGSTAVLCQRPRDAEHALRRVGAPDSLKARPGTTAVTGVARTLQPALGPSVEPYIRARRARRAAAENLPEDPFTLAEALTLIAKSLYTGSSESTLAVGLTSEKKLVVVKKGGTVDQEAVIELGNRFLGDRFDLDPKGLRFDPSNVTVEASGEHSGKHAEMLLWREYRGGLLAVGASQPICVDCGGFLNQNGIAHGGCETGDGRKYWWDPEDNVTYTDNIKSDGIPTVTKGT